MLEPPSRELVSDSALGRLFFCNLRRDWSTLFDRGCALLLSRLTGGAFRCFGSVVWVEKVPGCKISKPVPCPLRIVDSRFSNDGRGRGAGVVAGWAVVCLAAIGVVKGRLGVRSPALGRELLLLLPILLILFARLAGLDSEDAGAVEQNLVNGVTSGRLDRRTAGGKLSS